MKQVVGPLRDSDQGNKASGENFVLHDVSAFPVVRFRADLARSGYAALWATEMAVLLDRAKFFAIIAPANDRVEDRTDWQDRAVWMKEHREGLARYCRAVVSIEPDADRRADLLVQVAGFQKVFGISQHVAATEADAIRIAREMIDKTDTVKEALRILALRQQYDRP